VNVMRKFFDLLYQDHSPYVGFAPVSTTSASH
jgi:hypothetical protein